MKNILTKKVLIGLGIIVLIFVGLLVYLFEGNMDAFANRIPEVEKTQYMDNVKDKRNLRYGEVIPVYKKGAKLYLEVYNTMGSNELPQALWEKLDADKMAKTYGAKKVILNGPRYWVLNEIKGSSQTAEGKVVDFGGIEMTQRAVLHANIFSGTVGGKTYKENVVNRSTTYEYWKGNMVYELIAPDGSVYRMQSYSQQIDPTLTIDRLENLGSSLKLPEGWQYIASVLKEDSILKANGEAYVINDELGNSYQKVTD
ncbi:hypothetical protein [Fusibacter bizertensis]